MEDIFGAHPCTIYMIQYLFSEDIQYTWQFLMILKYDSVCTNAQFGVLILQSSFNFQTQYHQLSDQIQDIAGPLRGVPHSRL